MRRRGSLFRASYKDRHTGEKRLSPYWTIQYQQGDRRVRETTTYEKKRDAELLLAERLAAVSRGEPAYHASRKLTVGQLLDSLLTDTRLNHPRSVSRYENAAQHVREALGHRWAMSLATPDVDTYIEQRLSTRAARATVALELAVLRHSFRLAYQRDLLPRMPYIPHLKLDNVRTHFLTPEQHASIIQHLPDHLQPLARMSEQTGWRPGEVKGLKWSQVEWKAGVIRLDVGATKNKDGREYPLVGAVRGILEEQRRRCDVLQKQLGRIIPSVWFYYHGKRRGQPVRNWDRAWRAACERAGVPWAWRHDYRRGEVRRLEQAGISRSIAMKLTGHKTEAVYRRYAIVSTEDLRDALAKVQARSKQPAPTAVSAGQQASHPSD